MRTLYLDCGMGAAGDMLTAALLELLPNPDEFIEELNDLGIPGVCIHRESSVKCGMKGTHISVTIHGREEGSIDYGHKYEHSGEQEQNFGHNSLHDIEHIVRKQLSLPAKVQDDIMAVYQMIAEAESSVHGVPVSQIHFHEVGAMDAIADITAVCMLMERLSPDEVVVSPIHVGSGQVRCAHGILPIPAPATAYILKGVPIYGGNIQGELCTPTGAALLKYFATRFDSMPVMKVQAIGYGMGKKDFEVANCVRGMLGEEEEKSDMVLELSCNVDDMTAEAIGFAMERLFEKGALEVYTTPIGMKKSRPGTMISVMCSEKNKQKMAELLFKHTTTIGIRELKANRYVLHRKITVRETPYGTVHCKEATGYGVCRSKYEYEDLVRIARKQGLSLQEVSETIIKKFE